MVTAGEGGGGTGVLRCPGCHGVEWKRPRQRNQLGAGKEERYLFISSDFFLLFF